MGTLLDWAWVAVCAAMTAIAIPTVKYYWERRRWHNFEGFVRLWAREEAFWDDLSDQEWRALAATKLSEAGFEPSKAEGLLELAVLFAKARASQELRGRIQLAAKE